MLMLCVCPAAYPEDTRIPRSAERRFVLKPNCGCQVMPPELVADISQHACATLLTAGRAGHCCLFEGMTASNWAARVAVEFAITTRNFGDESEKKQAAPQKGAKKAKGKAKAS